MNTAVKQAEKLEKTLNWLMGVSIALLGVSSALMSIAALADLTLPPMLLRALGIVSLLSLPVLTYSAVRKVLRAREASAQPAKTAATNGVKRPKKKKRRK